MNDRDRLIVLLEGKSIDTSADVEYVADYLIANGVGIAKNATTTWISVGDRLPQPHKLVLCIWLKSDDDIRYGFATYQRKDVWYVSNEGMPRVTHWMPLPEPPKGVEQCLKD